MTDQKQEQPKRKAGRPGRDWDTLFGEWVKSGLPRKDFLASKGISPESGSATRNTGHWEGVAREEANKLHRQAGGLGSRVRHALVDNVVRPPEAALVDTDEQADARDVVATPVSVDRSSWNRVMDWRAKQAGHDWRTSDTIRLHIGLILKNGLQPVVTTAQDGTVRNEYRSMLKPSDVRQLAQAAADVQRMQRLALGLSTDNIGIDLPSVTPDGAEAAQVATADKTPNLFVVQLTKGGKFVTARPRRAS